MSHNKSSIISLHAFDNEEDSMLVDINSLSCENDFDYLQKSVHSLEREDNIRVSSSNAHLANLENGFKSTCNEFHNVDIKFLKGKNVFLDTKFNEQIFSKEEELTVYTSENNSEFPNGIVLDYVVNSETVINFHLLDSSPIVQSLEHFIDDSKFLDPVKESEHKSINLQNYSNIDSSSKSYLMSKSLLKCESTAEERKSKGESRTKTEIKIDSNNKSNSRSDYKLKVCSQCPMTFKYKRHFDRHMEGHEKNNCSHCNAKFARRKHLDVHLFRIHGERINNKYHHSCDLCFNNFPKRILLNRHRAIHFENGKVCSECGAMMESDEDIKHHKLKHEKEKQFKCTRCPQIFSTEQTYQSHIQNHDNYKCSSCDASFASKKTAGEHYRLSHSTKVQSIKPMVDGLYFCSDCHQGFVKKSGYCRHLETAMHLNKVNQETPPKALFACPVCKKTLTTRPACVQHIRRVHKGEKKLTCDTKGCSFQCAYKNDLERHKQLHVEERNVVCEYCGKAFTSISILKDHILYIHNKERQFVCEECGKSFKRNSLLNRHKLSHQQLRPYACKQCSAAFKRSHHLTRHLESCHRLTLEKKRRVVKLMKADNGDLIPVPDQIKKSLCNKTNIQAQAEFKMHNKPKLDSSLNQNSIESQSGSNHFSNAQNDEEKQEDDDNNNNNLAIEVPNQLLQVDTSPIVSLVDVHSGQVVTVVSNQESLPINDIVNQFEESCNEILDLEFQNEILSREQNYYDHACYSELQIEDVDENLLNSNNTKDPIIDSYLTQNFPSFLNL